MNIETIKGFRDIEDASKRVAIRNIIENTFKLYGFQPVETPTIEYEEFVKGENASDEAVSDIFKLKDKGERNLALRYEFTFQLKRLAKNKKLPFKRYQIGEVFRDEPVSSNRFRQFTQCDFDIVGSSLRDDAEILKIIYEILQKLKIKFILKVNNRKLLNEIMEEQSIRQEDRMQVIREIDKLDKLTEKEVEENLKKLKAEKLLEIFKKPASYFKKYTSYKEIEEVKKYCKEFNVKINFQPALARGLSYYNSTVFEAKALNSELKESIVAGGAFLVNEIQATGASFGLDRIEILSKLNIENKNVLIISIGQDTKAIKLAEKIRNSNIPCSVFYNKIMKALEYANSYEIPYVIFLGEEEVKKKKLKLRDMSSGKETFLSEEELIKKLKAE
jgi:histidyl-tRNA synthetase